MRNTTVFIIFGLLMAGFFASGVMAQPETGTLIHRIEQLEKRLEALEQQFEDRAKRDELWMPEAGLGADPFLEIEKMRDEMNQFFKTGFQSDGSLAQQMLSQDQFNIKEEDDAYVITVDIPGMSQEGIDVRAQGGMLVISGERVSLVEENSPGIYVKQHSAERFSRTLPLPADAWPETLKVDYADEVLTVTIGRKDPLSIKE